MAVLIVLGLPCAFVGMAIGANKGRAGIGLLLGIPGVIGLLIIAVLGPTTEEQAHHNRSDQSESVVVAKRTLRLSLNALLFAVAAVAGLYIVLLFASGSVGSLREGRIGSAAWSPLLALVTPVGAGIAYRWGRTRGDSPLRLAQRVAVTSLAASYLSVVLVYVLIVLLSASSARSSVATDAISA
jgi:hypothetical protein